jgi:hypothetical protein
MIAVLQIYKHEHLLWKVHFTLCEWVHMSSSFYLSPPLLSYCYLCYTQWLARPWRETKGVFATLYHHGSADPTSLGLKWLGSDSARHRVCEGGPGARLRTLSVVCHQIGSRAERGVATLHCDVVALPPEKPHRHFIKHLVDTAPTPA